MYTLVIDKPDIFEASISIEGAESSDAKCRLVIEVNNMLLMFEGDIKNEKCQIPIKKLKKYLNEGDTGKMILEVIADDTFFSPWQSEFKAKVVRRVTAEVVDKVNVNVKPQIVVKEVINNVKTDPKPVFENKDIIIKKLSEEFSRYKMKIEEVSKRKKTIVHVVTTLVNEGIIKKELKDDPSLVDIILESIVLSENTRK